MSYIPPECFVSLSFYDIKTLHHHLSSQKFFSLLDLVTKIFINSVYMTYIEWKLL